MKTLVEIRLWVEEESQKDTPPTPLFTSLCDELTLVSLWEKQLHKHTLDEQLEHLACVAIFEQLPPPIRFQISMRNGNDSDKIREYIKSKWNIGKPERDTVEQSIRKFADMDPVIARSYDFNKRLFFCSEDVKLLDLIDNSVKVMNDLFENPPVIK